MSTPCVPNGVLGVGDCPATLRICVTPGAMIAKDIQLLDPQTREPVPWPAGMTAWLEVASGRFRETYPATVDGNLLRFLISGASTVHWPRYACVRLWLQYAEYPDNNPVVWLSGQVEGGCC